MHGKKHQYIVMFFSFVVMVVFLISCTTANRSHQPTEAPGDRSVLQDRIPTPTPSPPAKASPTPAATPAPAPDSAPLPTKPGGPPALLPTGKVILVSLSQQWLYAYEDGKLVFDHAVETGRPELPTPTGTFTILEKSQDVVFTSPWPKDSPYYYEPTPINYAMLFKEGGFFLHDAPWHVQFGPGSNEPHQLPDGSWETGSHGCVGMPIPDAQRLYEWLPVGTPVIISN
jgi:lipoprotein-anchoring transpeptidase ErfK/SrfK